MASLNIMLVINLIYSNLPEPKITCSHLKASFFKTNVKLLSLSGR